MQIIKWAELNADAKLQALARNSATTDEALHANVKEIINYVANNGDAALFEYAVKFDKVRLNSLSVASDEYQSVDTLAAADKDAILLAINNIRAYHKTSTPTGFEYQKNGIRLGKMYRPIEKVGLYVPGGTAPLVSTVMMLAIPAQIAGCETRILMTPPRSDGTVAPAILFAARECGINTIYKVGGAQAIAALALGTETIPQVHKIFGPGNKYVTAAKSIVSLGVNGVIGVAIDMPAGPSEVLVIADANANAKFIASDLLAQAEHDVAAHVVFVTLSAGLAERVNKEIELQVQALSRKEIAQAALQHSVIIVVDSVAECFDVSNRYAPEHLILHLEDAKNYLPQVKNAGSVFIGQFSPEAVGDYASGPNHVLPTYGYANMYSGLDVLHFMKAISYQELSQDGLQGIAETVMRLADLEGLDAHKNAVKVRYKK